MSKTANTKLKRKVKTSEINIKILNRLRNGETLLPKKKWKNTHNMT